MSQWTELVVAGAPRPQGSKRAIVHRSTGKAVLIESGHTNLRAWRTAIAAEARKAMRGRSPHPTGTPVEMRVVFMVRKPKSAPKTRRTWPVTRASFDVDKALRAVLDALTGVAFADDSQVVCVHELRKDYSLDGWTGAHIAFRVIDGSAPSRVSQ